MFILASAGQSARAQSISQIKASDQYLYGQATGYTLKEAEDAALAALVRQISIKIEHEARNEESEIARGDELVESQTRSESIIKTYSTATLNNTRKIIIKDEPDAEVFMYVLVSEIDRIFESRIEKAKCLVGYADDALEKLQIDDALRCLYWSYSLVKSLRYPNETYIEVGGEKKYLITEIPTRINDILGNLGCSLVRREGNEYDLYVKYLDKPVKSLDYVFFDGADYSPPYSIADGVGLVDLRSGFAGKTVNLKVEYEFEYMAVSDPEVEAVLDAQRKSLFPKANMVLRIPAASQSKKAEELVAGSTVNVDKSLQMNLDSEAYVDKVLAISEGIKSANVSSLRNMFTDYGWDEFSKILSYGSIMINDNCELNCFSSEGYVVCRGLSCNFKFSNKKVFNETLSFNFDKEGKVSHVALGLGKITMNDILTKSNWGEESRKKLVSFLEDYRTAYAVKNAEYMERVFDDNAVIIVGHVLKRDVNNTDRTYVDNKFVKMTRMTKKEFLQRLRVSFMSKGYINLHFSDLEVMKLRPDQEKYGIQVRQDYYSSNYGDTGYLYLLVDLTDIARPVIHVRTWQEEPDPEFGVIGPGNF